MIARVCLDSPLPALDRLFDYDVPEQLHDSVAVGVRVRVPVRAAGRVMDGFVVEVAEASAYVGALSVLDEVVSPVPVLTEEVWALARRAADRAVGTALGRPQARDPQATGPGRDGVGGDHARGPTRAVRTTGDGYPSGQLEAAVARGARLAVRAIPEPLAWARTLAELASGVVAAGRTALLLVPDHRDLEPLARAVTEAVGAARVLRLDAEQSAGARYRAFLRAAAEEGVVVLGTRSAAYAPARALGAHRDVG